ncbi:Teichoic acid translocation permease protein TagG [Planctomycetes bacterium Pla163]|uniref:Teichoic acid translocation permease protein TagG n=1 Tax=Rohdeia mirabilis TaxID=2528008 RepID=A0A518CYI7_9BACT|nr:Teichoic acid translocation permease protein TagG [Planctomycetes bacterium Pla163]
MSSPDQPVPAAGSKASSGTSTEPSKAGPDTLDAASNPFVDEQFDAAHATFEGAWIGSSPPGISHVLGRIVGFPRLLLKHQDLVVTAVKRELEARFTGTLLGWVWPLVYPAFMFAVYYFVFTKLLQLKMPKLPPGLEPAMGVFMFTGILIWTGVSEGFVRGTSSIVDNGNLIKKLAFPTELLPLNAVLVAHVTMLFGVVAFVLATLTPVWPLPGRDLLWVLAILPFQLLFTYGLSLFLATCHVFLRDTLQLVTLLATVWMFITPIFWVPSAAVMGEDFEPYLEPLTYNPIYHLVYVWRCGLMNREKLLSLDHEVFGQVFATAPSHSLVVFAAWSIGIFLVGFMVYGLSQRRFADEV